MSRIKRHQKLWQKFIANILLLNVSKQRLVIKLFKGLWFVLAWPFELFGDLLIWPQSIKKIPNNPKILIIKIDQLGDLLFSTFLLPIIKEAYPNGQIDYLINPSREVVIKENPLVNRVYYWQDLFLQNIPGRQKLSLITRLKKFFQSQKQNSYSWRQLRQQKYDLVINARAFWPSSNWSWFRLGKRLIAFDFSQASYLANYAADYDLRAEEWQNYLNLLRPLAIGSEIINRHRTGGQFFNFSPAPHKPTKPYWCLSPVSFDSEKTWHQTQWVSFIQNFLVAQPGHNLILTGLPDQIDWLKLITVNFVDEPRVSCLTNLSIPQLAELLKNSQGFIGLESFAAHLAIALKKNVFCLINSRLFYVSGLSKNNLVDGRSMIPLLPNVFVRDLVSLSSEELVQLIISKP